MSNLIVSKLSERFKLLQSTYNEAVERIELPIGSMLHKVYFHCLPNPMVATFDIRAELFFERQNSTLSTLPARVTTNPAQVFANLFPSSTDPATTAENSISIAYQGDASAYVLFPRVHIAAADTLRLAITQAKNLATGANLAAVKYYLAVDSASLPF